MSSLAVERIGKRFGGFPALTDVSLSVEDGSFCVLLGPSGCGKSTLLNIIAGLIPQDGGSVLMDGSPVDHLSPRERDVAMVFQGYALYPHMTVEQNLGFGLRMRGTGRELMKQRIEEAARLLGIGDLLSRKPRELSGGQRQRVAMGRALVRRPRLFLFDEPLSNLDARLRASVRLELKRIHEYIRGTVVYVTHDQVEALTLGNVIVVMEAGRIRQIGSPGDIYRRPADRFVATFVGSPEMNLFRGTIRTEGGRSVFRGDDFSLELEKPLPAGPEDEVEIGIRPEDLEVHPPGAAPINAVVELTSDIGAERYLQVRVGGKTLSVRVPEDRDLPSGGGVSLAVKPGRLHVFRNGLRAE